MLKNNPTLHVVRKGVETHKELASMSPGRIYDKLKKDAKTDCNSSEHGREPPEAQDSLQDKLDRMGGVKTNIEETGTEIEQLSASIIPPSERNSTFNYDEFTDCIGI